MTPVSHDDPLDSWTSMFCARAAGHDDGRCVTQTSFCAVQGLASALLIAASVGLRDRRTLGCANMLMLCYSHATPVISMMTVAIDSLPVNKSLCSSFRGATRGSCMTCCEIWVHAAAQLRRSLEPAVVSFPYWWGAGWRRTGVILVLVFSQQRFRYS